jgi:hypothetical protein
MALSFMRTAGLLVSVSSLAGCTLALGDTIDKKQCTKVEDCNPAGELAKYACVSNVCTDVSCGDSCRPGEVCSAGMCVAAECVIDDDCKDKKSRCGYDGRCYSTWGCLDDQRDWPNPPQTPFHYKTGLEVFDGSPLGDINVTACNAEDTNCATSIVPPSQIKLTDGTLDLEFSKVKAEGFNGSIKVSPVKTDAWMTVYFQISGSTPLAASYTRTKSLKLLIPSVLKTFKDVLGLAIEPTNPFTSLELFDCGGKPAKDVIVTAVNEDPANPRTIFYPVMDGVPAVPAPGQVLPTGEAGAGFMLTLPPKFAGVNLTDTVTGRKFGPLAFSTTVNAFNDVIYYPRYRAVKAWMDYNEKSKTGDAGM